MNSTNPNQLIEKLKSVLLKKRLVLFFAGLIITIAAVTGTALVLSLVAQVVILPVAAKVVLLILSALVAGYFFSVYALKKVFEGSVDSVAVELETKHPELKGLLIAAIQFARMNTNPGYSSELLEATSDKALNVTERLNFNEAVSLYPVFRTGKYLAVSVVTAVLLLMLIPGLFSYSYEVYSSPTEVVAPPIAYSVTPFPGSTEWVKYRDIEIGAAIVGQRLPEEATIRYRLTGGSWQEEKMPLSRFMPVTTELGDSIRIGYKLRQINKSFDYYIIAGRVETEVQKVDVVDRPRVNELKLSIFYPDYTGLEPTVIDENNGSFSAVVGSRVNLNMTANLPIEQAELVFADSSHLPMKVEHNTGQASLVVENSSSYYLRLRDHLGEENPDPIEYYITAIPDEYPIVDVLFPGYDVNLNDDMLLPLKVRLYDDFGLSSLVLKYKIVSGNQQSEEHVAVIHYSDRITTEGEVDFNWDMLQLNMMPGDYAVYYFEVADNDKISGPKTSQSKKFIARVPSLEEIISQVDEQSTRRVITTEELLKSGKELSKRLKNASRKLQAETRQQNKKSAWQNQKELESIASKNEEMVDKIEQMADQMDKSLEQLNDKALLSQEIMDKMMQIQQLYEEIATPEMKEARERLMEAMKNMDPEQLEQAMKDFQMSQEELLNRLERTLALLKRMQLEQKMEAMIRQIEELVEKQSEMNDKTEASDENKLPGLSQKEMENKEALENLKKQLEDLDKLAQDAEMSDSEELKKFAEALEKTDANKDMQKMAQSLSDQQKKDASQEGKKALSKLSEMLNQMQQQMMAMQGEDSKEIENAMRRTIDDANYLSKNQEQLLKEAAQMQSQASLMQELAAEQQELMKSCNGLKNQISELGKQSPFLAAELENIVNQSTEQMMTAKELLEQRKGASAIQTQRNAMVNLNQASLRLMESLEQQKQCNSGGSCDKNTANLQSLSQKQNELNQKTQQQCQNPNGQNPSMGAGEGQRAMMQRLAGEQGAIRKSMEELAQEFGNSRQILGRLDDITKEMKEVEEALANGEAGPELTERQVRIFSRMLEASRSLYRKDFTEQRQAESSDSQVLYVPPELSDEILQGKVNLESRLQEYLKGEYPAQYQEQIKAYFKALLQIESNSQPNGNGQ